jgi:hypothetical protein
MDVMRSTKRAPGLALDQFRQTVQCCGRISLASGVGEVLEELSDFCSRFVREHAELGPVNGWLNAWSTGSISQLTVITCFQQS